MRSLECTRRISTLAVPFQRFIYSHPISSGWWLLRHTISAVAILPQSTHHFSTLSPPYRFSEVADPLTDILRTVELQKNAAILGKREITPTAQSRPVVEHSCEPYGAQYNSPILFQNQSVKSRELGSPPV